MPPPIPKPGSEKDQSAFKLFAWLWRDYLYKYKWLLVGATVLMMIEGSMLALISRMIQPMFDDVFAEGDQNALYFVGFAIMGIFFVRAITSSGQRILMALVKQLAAADMRKHMLRHLMSLDSGFFQLHPPGQLIERVQGDVGVINGVWSSLLTAVARDLVSLIGLLAVAIWIDWQWTLIAIIGIPLLIMPSLLVQAYIRRRSRNAREIAGNISTRLDEVFHGINPIKLNALETYQAQRYDKLIKDGVQASMRTSYGQAAVPALIDIMTGIGFLGVMLYGGSEIISGEKTNGEFMAFFTAMSLAFDPLRRLGLMSGQWQMAAASVERLQYVLNLHPTILSPAKAETVPKGSPTVSLENAHLNYGELPVLRGATFVAEAGKTTALVGASGAGKSTVFNVLTRLIEPNDGSVRINDTAITDYDLADLRSLFSVVTQDAALFDETLRDNILLGREDIDEAHLQSVLDAAHVSDFLPALPNGLDSPAGPRGSNLSGGQRQRVAIARALLRDTPILLLDEATSALDTKSEAIVQKALEKLSDGRTTLVIAHRLSTIRNADSIVVMDQGRVVDQGDHETLIARGGIYADLHRLQFSQAESQADA
ncbi:ABC transporter ATP-binding protein [Roseobacter sp. CCS2]|uniref:ABC transporter ATP-binding protein n=1 Tax=Roseobacter sp. CCS2 TaxID=391593 RepID=UPI0000F40503|nr:ABC transporter ATP-binding protein [Roseobacter sp. CCS2]EBA13133.1 efflux ABC transporter, transmembrane ATP-binding protein, putative [Roseobacter sp. CCS2]